jgi:hypothetical protein
MKIKNMKWKKNPVFLCVFTFQILYSKLFNKCYQTRCNINYFKIVNKRGILNLSIFLQVEMA